MPRKVCQGSSGKTEVRLGFEHGSLINSRNNRNWWSWRWRVRERSFPRSDFVRYHTRSGLQRVAE